jgi:uncharacterized integral membrane protein (TIGR00697 family)
MKIGNKEIKIGNRTFKKYEVMMYFLAVYSTFTVVQNLFEMKTLGTEAFAFGGGGGLLSWATFMIIDISTELFGKKDTIKLYTFAGLLNLLIVGIAQLIIALPGVYPDQNEAFRLIFSNGIRTALASFAAFWVGNYVNMTIMIKMKEAAPDGTNKFLLFLRAVVSTIFGQFVDNFTFATLAFAPVGLSAFEMTWKHILTSSLFGTGMETLHETIFVPLITIPVISKLRDRLVD